MDHDARTIVAQKLARKHKCRALIHKRRQSLIYISRIFNKLYIASDNNNSNNNTNSSNKPSSIATQPESLLWMGIYSLSHQSLDKLLEESVPADRVKQYLSLGISISSILDIPPIELSNTALLKSCLQLFEEWDYHYSSLAVQSVKFMLAKHSSAGRYPSVGSILEESGDLADSFQFRPTLYKFNNKIVHEYLLSSTVDNCSHDLDYFEAVVCLMECLENLYSRLIHQEFYSQAALYDGVLRVDEWIKHGIIDEIVRQVDEFVNRSVRNTLLDYRGSLLLRVDEAEEEAFGSAGGELRAPRGGFLPDIHNNS